MTTVDPAALLDDVARHLSRYIAFPSEHALHAVVLWAAHTHAVEAFDSSPRLALLSPEPGSGKTRVLEVLESLVPRPMHALSASPAPIFRSIATARPTLLFDEVDALFKKRGTDDTAEAMRALLNAGHRRGAAIPRCVGPTHAVTLFEVYAAAALAGLGDLPDTLMSRSVIIRMRRRSPSEVVEQFRHRFAAPEGRNIGGRLAAWAESITATLQHACPELPVTDRAADCWEPLVAIADAAGGHWPTTARSACAYLCKPEVRGEASLGLRLLADVRDAFGDDERLSTTALIERLVAMPEAPWGELYGRELKPRDLAKRLHAYGISSTKVKVAGESLRGYRREDLWDTWQRYLSPHPGGAEPTEPMEPPRPEASAWVPPASQVPEPAAGAEPGAPPLTCDVPQVPEVPDLQGTEGELWAS